MQVLLPYKPDINVKQFIELAAFYDPLNFIEFCKELEVPDRISTHVLPVNLDSITYGQRIDLSDINGENLLTLPLQIIAGLKDEQIIWLNASQVIRYGLMVIDELKRLNERDEKNLKYIPDKEELDAGINKMNHGIFGTLDNIARRMHCDQEDVLKMGQSRVYMMMKIDIDNANYAKRLRAVITKKK